jgi:hypothetical protein
MLITLSHEIDGFRTANIDKIRKNNYFLEKKVNFLVKFMRQPLPFSGLRAVNNGGDGCCAGSSASA